MQYLEVKAALIKSMNYSVNYGDWKYNFSTFRSGLTSPDFASKQWKDQTKVNATRVNQRGQRSNDPPCTQLSVGMFWRESSTLSTYTVSCLTQGCLTNKYYMKKDNKVTNKKQLIKIIQSQNGGSLIRKEGVWLVISSFGCRIIPECPELENSIVMPLWGK